MAYYKATLLVASMGILFFVGANAEGAGNDCNVYSLVPKLLPCFPAVKAGGSAPSPDCCHAISEVIEDSHNLQCLCAILGSEEAIGFGIDAATALSIPKKCEIDERTRHAGERCGDYVVP